MYKKPIVISGIVLLFIASSVIPMVSSDKSNFIKTIYVDDIPGSGLDNPPEDYTRIQDAIDNASDRDTIFVYNGTYHENYINIHNTINLIGENRDTTIIDANQAVDAIYVYVPYVNISGFNIQNAFRAGINLASNNSNYINISNNIFSNNAHGIHPYFTNKNLTISYNIFVNNVNGIYLVSSSYARVYKNNITNNSWGIRSSSSTYCEIYNNNITFYKKMGIELYLFSNNNYIHHNNFIRNSGSINAYFRQLSINNIWDKNYWDETRTRPYIIIGSILTYIPTWINVDWNPAVEPYDII